MWSLKYPREICTPKRRTVQTKQEFLDYVNTNIKHQNLFTTVYNYSEFEDRGHYTKPVYESAIIDRIYFDCDFHIHKNRDVIQVDGYQSMVNLHEWCLQEDIKHMCCFTGSGYNCIIAANGGDIQNKAGCVGNAQLALQEELNVVTDPQVVGDIARITRIPNTFNFKDKARRFVRCLSNDDIYKGHETIREMSKSQGKWITIGSNEWDIRQYDSEPTKRSYATISSERLEEIEADLPASAPECIKRLLGNGDLGYRERPILIIWLRDQGVLMEETISILKKYCTPRTFQHAVYDEKQPQYIYSRGLSLFFPKCSTLQKQGLCNTEGGYCGKR
jgi:hypothetical protein